MKHIVKAVVAGMLTAVLALLSRDEEDRCIGRRIRWGCGIYLPQPFLIHGKFHT